MFFTIRTTIVIWSSQMRSALAQKFYFCKFSIQFLSTDGSVAISENYIHNVQVLENWKAQGKSKSITFLKARNHSKRKVFNFFLAAFLVILGCQRYKRELVESFKLLYWRDLSAFSCYKNSQPQLNSLLGCCCWARSHFTSIPLRTVYI